MITQTNSISDAALIEKVLDGDVLSFSALIDRYNSFVFQIVLKISSNREFAEEVTQDTFLKVYKNLHNFEFNSKFSTWLYRIAYTTAISAKRKQSKLFLIGDWDLEIYQEEAESEYQDKIELDFEFKTALSNLGKTDNLIITLYYLNEQSIDDICIILNIKRSAVKTRLHRARKRLKKLLT